MLNENSTSEEGAIRETLSGNISRGSGYLSALVGVASIAEELCS